MAHVDTGTDAGSPRRGGCGCFSVAGGLLLVLVGVPMLILPGPGIVAILSGLGMIATGLGLRRRTVSAVRHADPS